MKEYLEVGKIVNTSGLKGLLKVSPLTDDITRFEDLSKYYAWGYCFLANLIMFAILLAIKESKWKRKKKYK